MTECLPIIYGFFCNLSAFPLAEIEMFLSLNGWAELTKTAISLDQSKKIDKIPSSHETCRSQPPDDAFMVRKFIHQLFGLLSSRNTFSLFNRCM